MRHRAQAAPDVRLLLEFPRWTEETIERLLGFFDGHCFSEQGLGAATLLAIGREAAVRMPIGVTFSFLAVPPFAARFGAYPAGRRHGRFRRCEIEK